MLEVELVEGVVGGRARVAVVVGVAVVEVRRLLLDPLPLDSLVLQLGFVLLEAAGRHLGLAPEADGVGGGRRPQLPHARLSCAVVRRRGSFVVVVTEMEAVTIQSVLFLCNLTEGGKRSAVLRGSKSLTNRAGNEGPHKGSQSQRRPPLGTRDRRVN